MRERDRQADRCLRDWSGFTTGMITSTNIPKRNSGLSDILEPNPHPKYFLSAKACQGILRRAEKRGKELPPMLKEALERQALCQKEMARHG